MSETEWAVGNAKAYEIRRVKLSHDRKMLYELVPQDICENPATLDRIVRVLAARQQELRDCFSEDRCLVSWLPTVTPEVLKMCRNEIPIKEVDRVENITAVLPKESAMLVFHRRPADGLYEVREYGLTRASMAELADIMGRKLLVLEHVLRPQAPHCGSMTQLGKIAAGMVVMGSLYADPERNEGATKGPSERINSVDSPRRMLHTLGENSITDTDTVSDDAEEMLTEEERLEVVNKIAENAEDRKLREAILATYATAANKLYIPEDAKTDSYRRTLFGDGEATPERLRGFLKDAAGRKFSRREVRAVAEAVQHFRKVFPGDLIYQKDDTKFPCNLFAVRVTDRSGNEAQAFRVAKVGGRSTRLTQKRHFPEGLDFS